MESIKYIYLHIVKNGLQQDLTAASKFLKVSKSSNYFLTMHVYISSKLNFVFQVMLNFTHIPVRGRLWDDWAPSNRYQEHSQPPPSPPLQSSWQGPGSHQAPGGDEPKQCPLWHRWKNSKKKYIFSEGFDLLGLGWDEFLGGHEECIVFSRSVTFGDNDLANVV